MDAVPDFTEEEVKQFWANLAKKKAGDDKGIVVETSQKGGRVMMRTLAALFMARARDV